MNHLNQRSKRPHDFNMLTFTEPCPSCGKEVEFAFIGSLVSVCTYCQTTLIYKDNNITPADKQSLPIDDDSPLQLGSNGTYDNMAFAIIGRIQFKSNNKIWNEWYIEFTDGTHGYLSEKAGQYVLMRQQEAPPHLPPYNNLRIGQFLYLSGKSHLTIKEKTAATAIAAEGELPLMVKPDEQTYRVKASYQRKWVIIQYGENSATSAPSAFHGSSVSLAQLNMQLLKDKKTENPSLNNDTQVNDGILDRLDCPNCAHPISYVAGATHFLICPECYSEIVVLDDIRVIIKHHNKLSLKESSLLLGDKARIYVDDIAEVLKLSSTTQNESLSSDSYHNYLIIGIIELKESYDAGDKSFVFNSIGYLLYSCSNGFLLLEESPSGWYIYRMLSILPNHDDHHLYYKNQTWHKEYDNHKSRILYAAGAFNQRVNLNNRMTRTAYSNGVNAIVRITRGGKSEESVYAVSSPALPINKINRWFDKDLKTTVYNEDITITILKIIFIIFVLAMVISSSWSAII